MTVYLVCLCVLAVTRPCLNNIIFCGVCDQVYGLKLSCIWLHGYSWQCLGAAQKLNYL